MPNPTKLVWCVTLTLGTAMHVSAQSATANSARGAQSAPIAPRTRPADTTTKIEIYGFVQADAIGDFKANNPDWFDVNRPSVLPKTPGEFGHDGHTWFSARQSRFGTKATIPTSTRDITITFEWDLFGVGPNAGQTTIRPRLMYGQWGDFGGGQLPSPFTDPDVRPIILDAWGPSGMTDFRNVQLFWQPVDRDNGTRLTFALERPIASGDAGPEVDLDEVQGIVTRFPAPDLTAGYRLGGRFGYAKLAVILRWIGWDILPNTVDASGTVTGWGASLSTGLTAGSQNVLRLEAAYGAGIENYLKDAPVDVGVARNPGHPAKPFKGVALPDLGIVAFIDHRWAEHFTSAIGYSRVDIDNSDLQAPTAFKSGQYALVNLVWTPVANVSAGGELQWARRENFKGDFSASDYRLQLSIKYRFSQEFGSPTVRAMGAPPAPSRLR